MRKIISSTPILLASITFIITITYSCSDSQRNTQISEIEQTIVYRVHIDSNYTDSTMFYTTYKVDLTAQDSVRLGTCYQLSKKNNNKIYGGWACLNTIKGLVHYFNDQTGKRERSIGYFEANGHQYSSEVIYYKDDNSIDDIKSTYVKITPSIDTISISTNNYKELDFHLDMTNAPVGKEVSYIARYFQRLTPIVIDSGNIDLSNEAHIKINIGSVTSNGELLIDFLYHTIDTSGQFTHRYPFSRIFYLRVD